MEEENWELAVGEHIKSDRYPEGEFFPPCPGGILHDPVTFYDPGISGGYLKAVKHFFVVLTPKRMPC